MNDAVNGVVRIIERPESRGEVFNLACGESRSRDEIVTLLREHFPDIRVKYSPREKLTSWRGTLSASYPGSPWPSTRRRGATWRS